MSKLPKLSGNDIQKILCNHFNFKAINSKGSHMTLIRTDVRPPILLTIVKCGEVQRGTLRQIITKAGLDREAFLEAANS